MGCDIHLRVQGRLPDGTWEYVRTSPFLKYSQEGFTWDDDPTERNYMVFAFLADVRNGFGFAGLASHTRVTPQFPARGLPDGASEDDALERTQPNLWTEFPAPDAPLNEYGDVPEPDGFIAGDDYMGDHSYTHATLAELRAAPWGVEFHSTGVVDDKEFAVFQAKGAPDNWSLDISGQGIQIYNNPEAYARMVAEGRIRRRGPETAMHGGCLDYCRVAWTWTPLAECAFRRWVDGPTMSALAADYGGPENVRVLMGFDS